MYVDDLVRFIHHALTHWDEIPEVTNVGYGEDFSVLDYYRMVCDVLKFRAEFRFDLSKPTGMKRKLMDSGEAFALGWRPLISHSEGIARTYQFFLEQHP